MSAENVAIVLKRRILRRKDAVRRVMDVVHRELAAFTEEEGRADVLDAIQREIGEIER